MAASNFDDVVEQLQSAGLIIDGPLQVGTPRPVRCRVEGGDREKRGWYRLFELPTSGGDLLIVGSYGAWHGADNGAQKIELRKREISPEQRDALRRRWAEDRKLAEQARQREAEQAARAAGAAWARYTETGESDYLAAKAVGGFGVRYTKAGAVVVPLLDAAGRIHGLQFLRTAAQATAAKRPAKEFWPRGLVKKGHFHLIGSPQHLVLIAEGYATAATLHMATGYPVAVAFDAGNLRPVAEALAKRHRRTRFLICADDDVLQKCRECGARLVLSIAPTDCPGCGQPHGAGNAGITDASAAALAVNGAFVAPRFADESARQAAFLGKGQKLTDFNDLHAVEGLHVVRAQVEARLSELGWHHPQTRAPITTPSGGGGDKGKLRSIETLDELLQRFALVYGHSGTVFDRREHCLLSLSDMRDACMRRDLHRSWMEHPARDLVRVREVGFDPAGEDPTITCNLWGGWPTAPKAGKCDRLLELLRYLCSDDRNPDSIYTWVLRWLAYPIQHPGAKMKSCLVLHGPQGTGKNLFFETVMAIYGEYGRIIGQDAVEDKFTDWASRKLFLIADEVVARAELYHIKNKLKALITGDWIRINAKNVAAYDERNHVNLVFLSNEAMPVVLEEDDRRHCVIWTPPEREPAFYDAVMREIADGGVAALHDYLLHLDLGDFRNGTRPPMTKAKDELIRLGLDSPQRFFDELATGQLPDLKAITGLARDWYGAYKHWCGLVGARPAPEPKFINALDRKRGVRSARKRYHDTYGSVVGPHGLLIFGAGEVPPGKSEQAWLGEQIEAARKQILDFRGRA